MSPETPKEQTLKTGSSSQLSHYRSRTLLHGRQRQSQLKTTKRIWFITGAFVIALISVAGALVLHKDPNDPLLQSAGNYKSQPLSKDVQSSLGADKLSAEDSLISGVVLQGGNVALVGTAGGVTNTVRFADPDGGNKIITLPNASGTIAVSASGPLVLDKNGNLSCPSCAETHANATNDSVTNVTNTTATNVTNNTIVNSGVGSINAVSGEVLLQGTPNQIILASAPDGQSITLSLPQDINVNASPVFANLDITQSLHVTNMITASSLTLGSALAVSSGGTGATSYTDGQLLIGNSATGGLVVATLNAGSGLTITNGNGTITIASPLAGLCPGCADRSLSNLSTVAINTDLLPANNNSIDAGSSTKAFKNGYFAGSVYTPSLDTAAPGSLNIGSAQATDIHLGADTSLAAGKNLAVNGTAIFKNAVNSTSAFQLQDSAGTSLLNANTTQGTISVGTYVPTTLWEQSPPTMLNYTTGTNPQGVTTADFNGDGRADIAVSNLTSSTVSVFFNNGGAFAAKVDYATNGADNLTSADFNGDGKPDIVTVSWATSKASVLLNNGDGTFAANVDYTTGNGASAVIAVDVNGDGKLDLAVAAVNSGVSVLINNGNGTFAPKVDYPTAGTPGSVASADVNGDGKPDLVTADRGSSTISVLLNKGNGTFALSASYPAGGGFANAVTLADFDGDSKPDIAVVSGPTNATDSLSILKNNGDGTFATKVDYATDSWPISVISADFNNDGHIDVAVGGNTVGCSNGCMDIFYNQGNGTFGPKTSYTVKPYSQALASADLNNDGQVDIAIADRASNMMSVILMTALTSRAVTQDPSKIVINAASNTVGQIIQGTAGQVADLLQVRDDANTNLFVVSAAGNAAVAGSLTVSGLTTLSGTTTVSGTMTTKSVLTASSTLNVTGTLNANGSAVFKKSANTTTAFQIQQANSTAVFTADTTNARIGIGSALPTNKLSVNTLTTADAAAQVAIGTGAVGSKGVVIQGIASQTANLFEAQSSTGSILASISPTGVLAVVSATVTGNITINGHIVTGGTAPTIAAGAAACSTPTVSVMGNDTAGTITVTTGTGCGTSGAGNLAVLTFNSVFGAAPVVALTPGNAAAAGLQVYVSQTTTSFTLSSITIPADSTVYTYNYHVFQ